MSLERVRRILAAHGVEVREDFAVSPWVHIVTRETGETLIPLANLTSMPELLAFLGY